MRAKRRMFFCFLCFLFAITAMGRGAITPSGTDTLFKKVDELFIEWDKWDSPGAALAVIKDGSVIYKRGYGCAQLEYNIPITPSTIFHVASVSKQFTAFAITMLAEEGKLSLDDDIRKYLPEVSDFKKTITIQHLIHHISGMRDQWELLAMAGWRLDDVITKEHILKMVKNQKELNFDPGAEHLYCNTGYTLLAEIVARVTDQTFPEWTEANIFKPLGMSSTHFHDDHEMIVKNRAYSYRPVEGGGFKKSVLSYANVGATSLFTTVEDLARWVMNFDEKRVGGDKVIQKMEERGILNNGEKIGYAFALSVDEHKGLKTVGHSGSDAGFRSYLVRFPEQKFAVVILSNLGSMNARRLAMQVTDIYLADHIKPEKPEDEPTEGKEVSVDPSLLARYTGSYQLRPGRLLTITLENGRLITQATGEAKFEMKPQSDTTFFVDTYGTPVTFVRDKDGNVNHLKYREIRAERVEPFTPTLEKLKEFTGDYSSDELGTTYTIAVEDSQLVARHRRNDDVSLYPTVADQFGSKRWWFRCVDFKREEGGRVIGFRLTGGRVRNLRFDKSNH